MANEQENGAILMKAWGEEPYGNTKDEVESDDHPAAFPDTQQELFGFD